MDEDDAEIYGKKLKKSLAELKFKDLTILHIHGSFLDSSTETKIYV